MSDTALPFIIRFDTTANRLAFTPSPGVAEQLYVWLDSDDQPNSYYWDGANWQPYAGGGSGDVVGPASAVDDRIATFDGTTGKLIQDGGMTIAQILAAIPAAGITELTSDVTAGPGSGSQAATVKNSLRTMQIGITVDGGGSVITTGIKGYKSCPVAGTITGVRMLADQGGAAVMDIWKDTYANYPPTVADTITASAKPTITATSDKSEDTTLTGWTTSIAAGDVFGFNVDSVTTIQRLTLELTILVS